MSPTEQSRWFETEVLSHESSLRSYLQARFPSVRDQDDLVQETYTRVLRAKEHGVVKHPRGLLFVAARNAALDMCRRQRASPRQETDSSIEIVALDEARGVRESLGLQQELEILALAVRALPERCRQVVMLRYLEGLSYKEIAARLDISPETVKLHIAKGMKRCADFFASHGLPNGERPEKL